MATSVRHAGDGHRVRWSGDHPAVQVLRLREGPDASGVRENIETSSVSRRNQKKKRIRPSNNYVTDQPSPDCTVQTQSSRAQVLECGQKCKNIKRFL